MSSQNTAMDIEEVRGLIADTESNVLSLKDNVINFWQGRAAISYQDILIQSIDFTRLSDLLNQLEQEVSAAEKILANLDR